MSVLDIGLAIAGLPQATINELDSGLPSLQRIEAAFQKAEPHITAIIPILNEVWPDIVKVTPLIRDLIAFAKQKEGEQ